MALKFHENKDFVSGRIIAKCRLSNVFATEVSEPFVVKKIKEMIISEVYNIGLYLNYMYVVMKWKFVTSTDGNSLISV